MFNNPCAFTNKKSRTSKSHCDIPNGGEHFPYWNLSYFPHITSFPKIKFATTMYIKDSLFGILHNLSVFVLVRMVICLLFLCVLLLFYDFAHTCRNFNLFAFDIHFDFVIGSASDIVFTFSVEAHVGFHLFCCAQSTLITQKHFTILK